MIFIIAFAILAGAALGQAEQKAAFDKAHPELFDYENGDYALITDWTGVEWDQIPPSRIREVPEDLLNYNKLYAAQRLEMTTGQIAKNLEAIENLFDDVDLHRAQEAIQQAYHITSVMMDGPTSIKNGIMYGKDDEYSLPLAGLPPTAAINVKSYGVIILMNVNNPPATGTFHLSVIGMQDILFPSGVHGKVDGGQHGDSLIFRQGTAFIRARSSTDIEGLHIRAGREDLAVYVGDRAQNAEMYVAKMFVNINPNNKRLIVAAKEKDEEIGDLSDGIAISFLKGNPFLPVQYDENAYLDASLGTITIENRGETIAPLVTMESLRSSNYLRTLEPELELMNGRNMFGIKNGKLYSTASEPLGDEELISTPLIIKMTTQKYDDAIEGIESKEAVLMLEDGKPGKIIMDDHDNYAVIPESATKEESECHSCLSNFFSSATLSYDTENGDLWRYLNEQNIHVSGDLQTALSVLRMAMALPEALRNEIKELHVLRNQELALQCMHYSSAGCAISDRVYITQDVTDSTLAHEVGHLLTFNHDEREETPQGRAEKAYQLELTRKYSLTDPDALYSYEPGQRIHGNDEGNNLIEIQLTNEEQQNLVRLIQDRKKSKAFSFRGRWEQISTRTYSDEYHSQPDTHSFIPNKGCITYYGCSSFYEDVAEYVALVVAEERYGDFRKEHIIQPPGHPDHDPAKYDPRYKQKLDLLLEYNFITKADYDKIFEGVT